MRGSPPINRKPPASSRGRFARLLRRAGWKQVAFGIFLLACLVVVSAFVYYDVLFSRLIDARLSGDVFNSASLVFAAPKPVAVGEPATPEELTSHLRRAGYAEGEGNSIGSYKLASNRLEIEPGQASFFRGDLARERGADVVFRNGVITSITEHESNKALQSYLLEPEIITTLFDRNRTKRRLVRYQDLPKVLIDAILATEDHRFFSHHGVNLYRVAAAAVADLRAEEKVQGASTLTMQLARNFFLTPRRTMRRKLAEMFLALLMEQRLSKEQIFELYANQVYLGQRGSFSIYGVGEAASVYFNKDVHSLNLPESALLTALIRGPNLYSPYRYPERALERRNLVLRRMVQTGFLTTAEAEKAGAAPLGVSRQNGEGTQAPFLVDMVRDQLLAQFSERDLLSQSYRIYTTLDLDLQRAASEAVRAGMAEVDQEIRKQRRKNARVEPHQPQVALVALDPRTGALQALVGGRGYGISQLNHVLARRQPGSSFKPFVYAAALNSGVDGSQPLVTPATILMDEPTTFLFGTTTYEPENYKHQFHGAVTARDALVHSLNVATVRLAEMVGYGKVRSLAILAGLNKDVQATPSIALGAYVATPLEIAGGYTIFANGGQYVTPRFIQGVNDTWGRALWRTPVTTLQVLDPRVDYLMVSMMESVINNGTGAGVRSRGFTLPAAGKTGTSHDGWFAGFTSDLLAVVWVGYDDDRELKLSGASSALPIWTEFMKRATQLPAYRNAQPFAPPPGVVSAPIEVHTSSDAGDPVITRQEVFIAGTEPRPELQPLEEHRGILERIFHPGRSTSPAAATTDSPQPPDLSTARGDAPVPPGSDQQPAASDQAQKKNGVLKKFLSIFKGGKSGTEQKEPPPKKPEQ